MKSIAALFLFAPMAVAAPKAAHACRTIYLVANHEGTQSAYSIAGPGIGAKGMLLLLPGGGKHIDLDADGCPQKLKGNSLVRKRPLFHDAGYMTALLDAPSDHHRKSGLGGFRIAKEHASDIGKIIAKLRTLGKHARLVDRNQPWRDLPQQRCF